MEVGQIAKSGTLYLSRILYPVLRDGPNEAYHKMVVCTTGVVACAGPAQPGDVGFAGPVCGESGWLVGLSGTVGWSCCEVCAREREAFSVRMQPIACFGALRASQLATACAAQRATEWAVVAQRRARLDGGSGVALGAVAVAGDRGVLAGAVWCGSVAGWALAAVAGTACAFHGLPGSGRVSSPVKG